MTNGAKLAVLAVLAVTLAFQVGFGWLFANLYSTHGRVWDFWVMMGMSGLYWGIKGVVAWWKGR